MESGGLETAKLSSSPAFAMLEAAAASPWQRLSQERFPGSAAILAAFVQDWTCVMPAESRRSKVEKRADLCNKCEACQKAAWLRTQ